jgi:hypothetical protein
VPITAISASILFALLKEADVSKSSSNGKNGQTVEGLRKAGHRLPEQKRPKIDGY